jgi:tRNA-Thr(GGU) m(6)t(6)A37 methyltransferase TsaA
MHRPTVETTFRATILWHHRGLAARPPVRYTLITAGGSAAEVDDGSSSPRQADRTSRGTRAMDFVIDPIGHVESTLRDRASAPKQGAGAPDAWLVIAPEYAEGLSDLRVGDEIVLLTWFDRADRTVLSTRPRDDPANPLTGVFSTRSPDRPNPIGLHVVRVRDRDGLRVQVGPLEALDGTPVVDLKPVLGPHER